MKEESDCKKENTYFLSNEIGLLFGLYVSFKENIINDLSIADFSDSLTQTIVFSVLFAKLNTNENEVINVETIAYKFFNNIPLIKGVLLIIKEFDNNKYRDINFQIYEIFGIFNSTKDIDLMFIFSEQNDPYIEFYENFLYSYDKKTKIDRGVFYTPQKIAEFIVREVDQILKKDFYCEDGVGDSRINILDFACGTGTFLLEIYKKVQNTEFIIKNNVFGFELMIAPYIIAHLRLSKFLNKNYSLPIFLTNTLEQNLKIKFSSVPAITEESKKAQQIKDKKICVIIGNPPYSVKSHNNNEYINKLLEDYYFIDGTKEKYTQALNDDYIKFIKFGQNKILKSYFGGILAVVLNHGFIDNPSFKAMRYSLLKTFDDMFFIDLNGNFRRQKFTKNKEKDENLIPVKQGICIAFFIKYPEEISKKNIYHTEIIGNKANKIIDLLKINLHNKNYWNISNPTQPFYSFKPINDLLKEEYDRGTVITDIFLEFGGGVTTSRDDFAMSIEKNEVLQRFIKFKNSIKNDNLYAEFNLVRKKGWDLLKIWDKFQNYSDSDIEQMIKPIHFRGFDVRYIMYDTDIVQNMGSMMTHLVENNIGLCFTGREIDTTNYSSVFVTDKILSFAMHYYGAKLAPMYLYKNGQKIPNFKDKFLIFLEHKYKTDFTSEQIFAYIYGSFNMLDYRKKYATFLSIDYPKIHFFDNFLEISNLGQKLLDAHLLRTKYSTNICFIGKDFVVDKVLYLENKLYINKTCYFDNISQSIYDFKIGCYPVLEKFLKPRKGLDISGEIDYIIDVANSIQFTLNFFSCN